ncbi:hypothetical protein EZS27_023257, partial [termite gut metagenome]
DLKQADEATLQQAKDAVAAAKTELQTQISSAQSNATAAATTAIAAAKVEILTSVDGKLGALKAGDYTLEELATIIAQLESLNLSQLATTVADLESKYEELAGGEGSGNAEDVLALQEKVAELDLQIGVLNAYLAGYTEGDPSVKTEIEAIKGEIETLKDQIAADGEGDEEAIEAIVNKILDSKLGELVTLQQVSSLITGIKLVEGNGVTFGYSNIPSKYTYTFGEEDNATPVTQFTTGKNIEGLTSSVLLQVFPANAELHDDLIYLVDGEGNDDINAYFNVKATPYSGLAVTKAAGAIPTGLYTVTFELDDSAYAANSDAFAKLIKAKFAIAVKNNVFGEADRYVLTDFGPKITYQDAKSYTPVYAVLGDVKLAFTVDKQPVANLHNRYPNTSKPEYVWTTDSKHSPTANADRVIAENDSRITKPSLNVEANKTFTVELDEVLKDAYAYYIGLDLQNATTSESLLWQKANAITGINTVYRITNADSRKATVKITDSALENQEIGFRLYVINKDGTLVDPDGRAFYIQYGKTTAIGPTLDFKLTVDKAATSWATATVSSDRLDTGNALDGVTFSSGVLSITLKNFDGKEIETTLPIEAYTAATDGTTASFDQANHRYLGITGLRAALLDDEGVQNGTLTLKDASQEVKKYNVTLKKVLPTANGWPTDKSITYKPLGEGLTPIFVTNSDKKVVGAVIEVTDLISGTLPTGYSLSLIDPQGRYAPVVSAKATATIVGNNTGSGITIDTDVLYINSREAVAVNPQYIAQLKYTYVGVRYGGGNLEVQKAEPLLVKFDIKKLYDYSVGTPTIIQQGDNSLVTTLQIQRKFYGDHTNIGGELFENITKTQFSAFYLPDKLKASLTIGSFVYKKISNAVVTLSPPPATSVTIDLDIKSFSESGEIIVQAGSLLQQTGNADVKKITDAIATYNTGKDASNAIAKITISAFSVKVKLQDIYDQSPELTQSLTGATADILLY